MPSSAGFGPLGPRASLTRPGPDADIYQGLQTWFKNCSSPGAADGTVPTASFFNHYIGNFVYAAAKAGVQLANDQSDDTYLWQIIQGAIAQALAQLAATGGTGGGTGGDGGTTNGATWTLI